MPSDAEHPETSTDTGGHARRLSVSVDLVYDVAQAADIMLQVGIGEFDRQTLVDHSYYSDTQLMIRDAPSNLVWAQVQQSFSCRYTALIDVTRPNADIQPLPTMALRDLPEEVMPYLVPSRYCPSDQFQKFAEDKFGASSGGQRVLDILAWVRNNLTYMIGTSNAQTTALDTFIARQGVCRDFAHLVITLVRASTIPARMVSGYGLGVKPQDFHALAEVYLDGAWHLIDATGMTEPNGIAKVSAGRDAADIAFMTIYGGAASLVNQSVMVSEV
ncbi:transglutaminase family protein [Phaeobacter sp. 22II1-1F12B]|uniref:transglutaminase-like domain-containing protein n=1 Tax=Phaeobacter sp. 22II1-1F12B TaxID=1317111 RepID=UPI000B5293D4|nr:transglutaminase family protein [Phaeobacter sp. 22II1-1F12B]